MASPGGHFLPESMTASGKGAKKLNLPTVQSKMKLDPESYETELQLLYRHFDSSLFLFQQNSTLNFGTLSSDPNASKELGDMAMFLAHVLPFYPKQLAAFPKQLFTLLQRTACSLPSMLRRHIAQALIRMVNRKMLDIGETLALFMELRVLGDRVLRKLAFSHVVHSIRLMNKKHKSDVKNRALQNILFAMLQEDDESRARRCLIVLCDLHRRKVWFDDRTAKAICTACFHTSSRIMIAALSFLLGYERIEDGNDSDGPSSEDDATP